MFRNVTDCLIEQRSKRRRAPVGELSFGITKRGKYVETQTTSYLVADCTRFIATPIDLELEVGLRAHWPFNVRFLAYEIAKAGNGVILCEAVVSEKGKQSRIAVEIDKIEMYFNARIDCRIVAIP